MSVEAITKKLQAIASDFYEIGEKTPMPGLDEGGSGLLSKIPNEFVAAAFLKGD